LSEEKLQLEFADEVREKKIKELKVEVDKLQQHNVSKVQALASLGRRVDSNFLANLKVDVFIEMFLDDVQKLQYVKALEEHLKKELDAGLAAARQEQIVQGVKDTKLFIPK
jgi:hypothetical protein